MPNLYIHAGAPKTGTSYLQVQFARFAMRLEQEGIIYPEGLASDIARSGGITSGNGVEMANFIRPDLPHKFPDKDAFLEKLDKQLRAADGKHVLYSSEFLSFPQGDKTSKLVNLIRANGYTPRFIYLVRNLGDAAFSGYSQSLKRNGETRPFAEFLRSWEPPYPREIKAAEAAFGRESLLINNFEEQRGRLAEFFFRDVLATDILPDNAMTVNRTLTFKEAEIQRMMNTSFPGNRKLSTFVSDALMTIDVERHKLALTVQETEYLEKRFRPAIDYVNGYVQGLPIVVTTDTVDAREDAIVGGFERAMVAIISKIVARVVK